MLLYWTKTDQFVKQQLLHPGRGASVGSAEAWSLLTYGLKQDLNLELPNIDILPGGRPWFPEMPNLYFSLSHTKGAAMAAVSRFPVGADVELQRPVRDATSRRLLETPHGDLELFALWTLRESWYKLTGTGDLRSIPIARENGRIILPESSEEIFCRLYNDIPGCAAAVCCQGEQPPESIQFIAPELLLRKTN